MHATGKATSKCNFCGVLGHFMCKCEIAQEYMWLGKCKHNTEGKIVLPSGVVIPQHITGAWLCNRMNEYHRLNPSQIVAAQMLMEMAAPIAPTPQAYPKARQFSVLKVVCFNPEVGQPGMFTYK